MVVKVAEKPKVKVLKTKPTRNEAIAKFLMQGGSLDEIAKNATEKCGTEYSGHLKSDVRHFGNFLVLCGILEKTEDGWKKK